MRTIIDLPEDQIEALRALCEREGISRAEAVRKAVDLLLEQKQARRREFEEALAAAAGSWKDYGIDGVEYQRKIRAEWDREWDPD